MRRLWCLAVALCLGLLPSLRAEDRPELVGPLPSVERLIPQLGDEDYHKRDLASRLIRGLGPDALPALRAARTQADLEGRRRLDELIQHLETTALLSPKYVTLDLRQKTLRQVLDEIGRQSGYKIETWGDASPQPYSFQFDHLPFWSALDQVCLAGGLVLQQGYGDNVVRLQGQASYVPYLCYDGPFRLVANSVHQERSLDFSLLPKSPNSIRRSENLNLTFSISPEPRLPLLGVGEPHVDAAYDSEHNSMLPRLAAPAVNPGAFFGHHVVARYGNGYRTFMQQVQLPLARPSEKASSIKLLKGTLPVTLLVGEKPEVVTDKLLDAKGKKLKVGDTSFAVGDVTTTPAKQYQIRLAITDESKEGSDNDYTWVNSLYYRLEVQDEKGGKYQVFGSNWMNSSARHVEIQFTYGSPGNTKLGPPTKLVYHTWSTMQTQVAFEFKDLPLP